MDHADSEEINRKMNLIIAANAIDEADVLIDTAIQVMATLPEMASYSSREARVGTIGKFLTMAIGTTQRDGKDMTGSAFIAAARAIDRLCEEIAKAKGDTP